jgi:acetylornithine deacetylase
MHSMLRDLIAIPSVSGQERPLVEHAARWARSVGLEVDEFETPESAVAGYPEGRARHLPLAGRPTLVVRLRGTGGGQSLMLNGHTDVVSAGEVSQWTHGPWSGEFDGERFYGRGACDVKGAIVSAMWAIERLAESKPRGDVLLELVPGEEDSVGLGTLTSVLRGYRADGVVVLEPTEGLPRCASRGGLRFEITVRGKSVHGTVKWHGVDAIRGAMDVMDRLRQMEVEYNTGGDEAFACYPIARPITVDRVVGGEWQGMVAERCMVGGYFELLPKDDVSRWREKFATDLDVGKEGRGNLDVSFPEVYTGHHVSADHKLCISAAETVDFLSGKSASVWTGFNAGCEAGLRFREHGSPTLVWGPGSLVQAHAADEFVNWSEVRTVAMGIERLARRWCD